MFCFWLPFSPFVKFLSMLTHFSAFSKAAEACLQHLWGQRRRVSAELWTHGSLQQGRKHCDGFLVYLLTSSPEGCGCVPPEPKLFPSSDASACCTLSLSAPRTSHKVWAWHHHAHGALISCWWLLRGHDRQPNTAPAPPAEYSLATEAVSVLLFCRQ